ncbi:hypothetical protein DCAR_0205428 [Daucus carota subsp. sativus]|uniref:F-box associated beta-propeller type 3 domain-containing protein n=2 Tax=Daucus carota subsp. sativus TaxID=79200 RepID=A0A161Y480_DAUCS|nr:hypothetical protein DCAR_0205428 [Daucus carota subsp. sativus]
MCTLFTDMDPLFDGSKHSKLFYTPESFATDVTCNNCFVRIHGVCNGLICLSCDCYSNPGQNIYLWNPICRKFKRLPQLGPSMENDSFFHLNAGVSFGCDGDDYKVIVIAQVDESYVVSVYSLTTNSWKYIKTSFYSQAASDESFFRDTKFVDGTAYMTTSSRVVVCFELINETIRVIEFPKEFSENTGVTMEAYGETIALLRHEKSYLTLWILRNKSSWEKKLSIELQEASPYHQAVGFLNNGKYMVRTLSLVGELRVVTKLYTCDLEMECPKLTEFRSYTQLRSRNRLPPKYSNFMGRIHSNYSGSLLLFNEDSVDPFVQTEETESSCNSMLFTLQWDV